MSARGSSNGRLAVFVASRFIEPVRRAIAEAFDAVFAETSEPLAELARSERVFDAIFFSLDVRMGADRIAALPPGIRALATYSVGLDHVDLEAARSRGLAVFNTPGVLGDSVAENAIFLMLGAARRATEAIGMLREGRWTGWMPDQLVGVQLGGRTLGDPGHGRHRPPRRRSGPGLRHVDPLLQPTAALRGRCGRGELPADAGSARRRLGRAARRVPLDEWRRAVSSTRPCSPMPVRA
ncbi:MAG: hypothetical protein R3E53_10240 [Myxococcota bacterium]